MNVYLPNQPQIVESDHLVCLIGHLVDVSEQVVVIIIIIVVLIIIKFIIVLVYLLTPSLLPSAQLGLHRTWLVKMSLIKQMYMMYHDGYSDCDIVMVMMIVMMMMIVIVIAIVMLNQHC